MNTALLVQKTNGIVVLTNNNPKALNALTPDFYLLLQENLKAAEEDNQIGAVVLTGANHYFCSGGDLKQLITRREQPEHIRKQNIEELHKTINAIRNCSKPVIAAVDGGAAGAGVSLALACDMLVMAEDAYMSLAYVKVGLNPDGGATALLAEIMPRQLLTQLVLTGERISAQRLHELGAVNNIAASKGALEKAIEIAQNLSQGPQRAMARIKDLAQSAYHNDFEAQLDAEATYMAKSLGDNESLEGINAFFEKRQADYVSLRRNNS